ncbi:hypothetical protein [Candidatus Nitrospira bockiana]
MTMLRLRLSVIAGMVLAAGLTAGCADTRYDRETAYRDRDATTTTEETRDKPIFGTSSDSGTFDYK